jgi:hypothetical protein
VQLTANTFLILLGGVALAAALAFGIGGREIAQDVLQRAYNRSGEVTPGGGGPAGGSGGSTRRDTTTGGDDRTTCTPDR